MKNQDQVIPCPVCSTKIPCDINQLLMGKKFNCPNEQCDTSVGLSQESKPIVEETITKFENLKRNKSK